MSTIFLDFLTIYFDNFLGICLHKAFLRFYFPIFILANGEIFHYLKVQKILYVIRFTQDTMVYMTSGNPEYINEVK